MNGIEWPLVTIEPTLTNVVSATDRGFELIADEKTKEEYCGLWKDVPAGMTNTMCTMFRNAISVGKG